MLGCMCAGQRNSGLGDITDQAPSGYYAYALTATEQAGLLARNPILAARVVEFINVVNTIGYNQAPEPSAGTDFSAAGILDYWLQKLPGWIPTWGLLVNDSYFGPVVVFPDASGTLHFTATSAPTGDINKPPYESPDQSPLAQIIGWVMIGVVGFLGLQAWRLSR
jgi:hypothetical protein